MTINKQDRRALILGGITLGVIALYLLVIEPAMHGYDAMANEHSALTARVGRIQFENREAAHYPREIATWERRGDALSPPGPYAEQATAVGEKIVAAAGKSKVNLKNLNWSAPTVWPDDPAFEMAVLNLDAEAGWEPVFQFVAAIYEIGGVLSVEEVDLTGDPKKPDKLTLSLRVSVLVKAPPQEGTQWAS